MFKPRYLYTLLLWLLLPYIFIHLLWRARKQPEYLHHIAERFGFYSIKSNRYIIWLHTVSVGETRAAASLVQALQAHYPDHQILLTHTTPTGREASEQLYGDKVLRVYLPYDYPFAVQRFLRHFKPQVGVLLETEIWFNLIHQCHATKTPLLLLNTRLSEKSAAGYARFSKLTQSGLSQLHSVSAQTQEDASRLANLGARNVSVMGNLKYDIVPPANMLELGGQLRSRFGTDRPVFLAASTRVGEEALIIEMLAKVTVPALLTVLVPRHPQRFDEVANLLTKHGIKFQRRSENQPVAAATQVVLGDSMGEMFAFYAACDVAFIGGSLLPFGGQNLIEACAVGKPVLIGPHTYNFTQASILAVEQGAALRVQDAESLALALNRLFSKPDELVQMGNAGLAFVRANQGATTKALAIIEQAMVRGTHPTPEVKLQ
jgi:3-deoxy-D-manno-octulosonic-acid transferase